MPVLAGWIGGWCADGLLDTVDKSFFARRVVCVFLLEHSLSTERKLAREKEKKSSKAFSYICCSSTWYMYTTTLVDGRVVRMRIVKPRRSSEATEVAGIPSPFPPPCF